MSILADEPASSLRVPEEQAAPVRVLVVDDDAGNREPLARRLIRRGFEVTTADDGLACLAAVDAEPFDAILLDVMMPGMSGLEVLTRLRQTHSSTELPIIMATARDGSAHIVEALELGANDYVTKPLDFPVVLARLEKQVAHRRSVEQVMRLKRSLSQRNIELEAANADLRRAEIRNLRELELAAKVQATYLPSRWVDVDVKAAWRYEPYSGLAGDAFNVVRLDDQNVGFYVLDVSGHGVAAALTAVTAARVLGPPTDPSSILTHLDADGRRVPASPLLVVQDLALRFQWNPDVAQFITLFYGVLHVPTRLLTYASAGHPGPICVRRDGSTRVLDSTCLPIGVDDTVPCEQDELVLDPGDRLYVYSDGVVESIDLHGRQFGMSRLTDRLSASAEITDLDQSLSTIIRSLDDWRSQQPATDDITLLAIECP